MQCVLSRKYMQKQAAMSKSVKYNNCEMKPHRFQIERDREEEGGVGKEEENGGLGETITKEKE